MPHHNSYDSFKTKKSIERKQNVINNIINIDRYESYLRIISDIKEDNYQEIIDEIKRLS